MTDENVGIIGLGIMGGAMARNLLDKGWTVSGFDTNPEIASALAADGVELTNDVAELARKTPIIMTSLPSPGAVVATAQAIADAKIEPRIIIELSTLALEPKFEFQTILLDAGHIPLDCPVSGTGAQAKARDLVVYASGDSKAINDARALFAGIAREAHDVGEFGNGSRMKYIANLLVAVHNVVSAEAMVLGMKAGLDPHRIVEVIGSGIGTSKIFDVRAPMMAKGKYQPPTAHMAIASKDLKIISQFAADLNCPAPMLSATEPVYAAAMSNGMAREDPAAVCAVLEDMAGIKRDADK